MKQVIVISLILLILSGCASPQHKDILADDPDFAPILPDTQEQPLVPTGSLFNTSYVNNLYSDSKARRVGDIISVILQENTSANKNSKTELSKDNTGTLDPIIGLGGNPITFKDDSIQFGYNQNTEFTGDSKANQGNSLRGAISVHVLRVLPNGNLMIRGEKWMTLNNGDEYIRLTGIIRAEDISSENTIMSTKVANARIQYSGTGAFAEAQEQGWLSRFFNSGWWPL
jgi:flagellar L-ring protein precursor FlgH